jgi:hypothetical protein
MPLPESSGQILYVLDVAQKLHEMEMGRLPLDPVAYKLYARRLKQALAGCTARDLPRNVSQAPALREAMADRYFVEHGHFTGERAAADIAWQVIDRVQDRLRG